MNMLEGDHIGKTLEIANSEERLQCKILGVIF
jgi:hypothetical protein